MKSVLINTPPQKDKNKLVDILPKAILFFGVSLLFLIALELMVNSLKVVGEGEVRNILSSSVNPFIALFVGLLATAIVQSSSLVTSIIVAMVAASNLSLATATYLVIGANVGTTITSMIVSLGHVTRKKEFRKAFAGSMIHVLFNIVTTLVIFPLEYYGGFLSKLSLYTASFIESSKAVLPFSFTGVVQFFTAPVSHFIVDTINSPIVSLIIALLLMVACLKIFSMLFKQVAINNFMSKIESFIFGNDHKALGWGILITAIVHSSSIITSFIVAMVATNRISLRKSFPFIMGANIGTTITALTASIGKSELAVAIALVHVFVNVLSVALVYPFPRVKNGIVEVCRKMGRMSIQYRAIGFVSVLVIFFLIPFVLIYFAVK